MAELIKNISSISDFFYVQDNYKQISKLSDKELKFIMLNLEKTSSIEEILDFINLNDWCNVEYKLLEENDLEALFYVKIIKIFENRKISPELVMYLDKNNSNILLMNDEGKEELNIIETFTDKLSPYISKKFIKSGDIVDIINNFLTEGYYLTSSMVSLKKWWEKVRRPSIDYPKGVPIKEVLEEVSKKDSFINSIIINIFDEMGENRILKIYIIIETINEKKLLINRSRLNKEIKALKVSFNKVSSELSDIEVTKQFAKSISEHKELSLAIMHDGNPYFHASLTNNQDGSVFDIMFQNTPKGSELVVLPQYATSMNSLSKFFNLVYSQFGEGQITEYSGS